MTRIQLRTDVTLVGDAAGKGSTILLLHAGGERRQVWAPVARRLAANGFRAIAYDLRGHGESGRTDAGSPRAHAQDVAAMVAAEPERPVIVGASLGGLVALLAVREKIVRDRVAAVILVDLVPDPPAHRVRSYLNAVGDGLAESPLVTDAFTRRDELRAAAAGLVDQAADARAGSRLSSRRGGCAPARAARSGSPRERPPRRGASRRARRPGRTRGGDPRVPR